MVDRGARFRSRMSGVLCLSLCGCGGGLQEAQPAPCAEASLAHTPVKPASSQRALADLVPVSDFVATLPRAATCGAPCGPDEAALRVSGSCICAIDVATLGSPAPPQDRWFIARGPSVVEAERDPLMACEEAPLEASEGTAPRACPWSGRELLVSYGTPARAATVASFTASHLLRVRTQQHFREPGELQAVPFSVPPGSTLVGVFRDNPFSGPPSGKGDPIFVVWRVLQPQ